MIIGSTRNGKTTYFGEEVLNKTINHANILVIDEIGSLELDEKGLCIVI